MTDLEVFRAMLERAGVRFNPYAGDDRPGQVVLHVAHDQDPYDGEPRGQWWATTTFRFDETGKLIGVLMEGD